MAFTIAQFLAYTTVYMYIDIVYVRTITNTQTTNLPANID